MKYIEILASLGNATKFFTLLGFVAIISGCGDVPEGPPDQQTIVRKVAEIDSGWKHGGYSEGPVTREKMEFVNNAEQIYKSYKGAAVKDWVCTVDGELNFFFICHSGNAAIVLMNIKTDIYIKDKIRFSGHIENIDFRGLFMNLEWLIFRSDVTVIMVRVDNVEVRR